jgi:pilus assembly protein CpaF
MGLLERMDKQRAVPRQDAQREYNDEHKELRETVHREVVELVNRRMVKENHTAQGTEIMNLVEGSLEEHGSLMARPEKARIAREVYDEICGLGPLEVLLADDSISEIMVNGARQVYIERRGKLTLSDVVFRDDAHVLNIIDRIVSPLGRHIDEANPMVDARLTDGSRVNAVIPPLSLKGPVLTIRKFSKNPLGIQDLIGFGSLSGPMAAFLEACVKGKLNIVVSGGTGSGKTTLLNVLSAFIPTDERIVTIEDAAELQLRQDHVVTLESRPANIEGKGAIVIRDLVRNALRMRPDRIVVGEVRGGEALDMLQAMNTGHDGSLTTAHANTPRDLLSRLETMVLMAGMELPVKAIREQIASAIDIVVQQSRMRDGTRKVTSICEVLGMEGEIITLQDIFTYETDGRTDASGKFHGRFKTSGIRPRCCEKIRGNGVHVSDEWFAVQGART